MEGAGRVAAKTEVAAQHQILYQQRERSCV